MSEPTNPIPPRKEPPWLLIVWIVVGAILLTLVTVIWLAVVPGDSFRSMREFTVILTVLFTIGPMPLVFGLLALAALGGSLQTYRRRAATLVLGHLSAAIQLNLPLPAYLRSATVGEGRLTRRRLFRLADDLEAGDSVAAALSGAARELPRLTLDRIAAAEQSFSLSQALGDILERERRRSNEAAPGMPSRNYVAIVLSVMVTVTWMLVIFVMPKFSQIFCDFGLQFPWITISLIQNFPPFLTGVLAAFGILTLLTILGRATRTLFIARPAPRMFDWITDPLLWYAPVYGRLERSRQTALACEALAEALIAGRPLPEALAIARLPSLNRVLRHKLFAWRQQIEAGVPLAAGARNAGMPGLLCDVLAGTTADDGGGAVQAVVFAGRAYAGMTSRTAAVLSAVAPVLTTGLLAVCIGYVALALFMPMITLLNGMTGGPGR